MTALAHALSACDVCLAHPRNCLYIVIVVARSPNKMPSAQVPAGRLRAALRCAARYLKEEHTAATSTRNGVPFLHRPAATAVGNSATVSFCSESPAVTDKCIMSVSTTKRRRVHTHVSRLHIFAQELGIRNGYWKIHLQSMLFHLFAPVPSSSFASIHCTCRPTNRLPLDRPRSCFLASLQLAFLAVPLRKQLRNG